MIRNIPVALCVVFASITTQAAEKNVRVTVAVIENVPPIQATTLLAQLEDPSRQAGVPEMSDEVREWLRKCLGEKEAGTTLQSGPPNKARVTYTVECQTGKIEFEACEDETLASQLHTGKLQIVAGKARWIDVAPCPDATEPPAEPKTEEPEAPKTNDSTPDGPPDELPLGDIPSTAPAANAQLAPAAKAESAPPEQVRPLMIQVFGSDGASIEPLASPKADVSSENLTLFLDGPVSLAQPTAAFTLAYSIGLPLKPGQLPEQGQLRIWAVVTNRTPLPWHNTRVVLVDKANGWSYSLGSIALEAGRSGRFPVKSMSAGPVPTAGDVAVFPVRVVSRSSPTGTASASTGKADGPDAYFDPKLAPQAFFLGEVLPGRNVVIQPKHLPTNVPTTIVSAGHPLYHHDRLPIVKLPDAKGVFILLAPIPGVRVGTETKAQRLATEWKGAKFKSVSAQSTKVKALNVVGAKTLLVGDTITRATGLRKSGKGWLLDLPAGVTEASWTGKRTDADNIDPLTDEFKKITGMAEAIKMLKASLSAAEAAIAAKDAKNDEVERLKAELKKLDGVNEAIVQITKFRAKLKEEEDGLKSLKSRREELLEARRPYVINQSAPGHALALEAASIALQNLDTESAISESAQRLTQANLSLYVFTQGSCEAERQPPVVQSVELTRYSIKR